MCEVLHVDSKRKEQGYKIQEDCLTGILSTLELFHDHSVVAVGDTKA